MATPIDEKSPAVQDATAREVAPVAPSKLPDYVAEEEIHKVEHDLVITGDDLANVQGTAEELSLEETRDILRDVIKNHENDQNFPIQVLHSMKEFVANHDIFEHPEKYATLITEMKVEAALIKDDSPYPEVRAVS